MRIKNTLPSALKYQAVVIESAARDRGLDFFDVVFELLDADAVNGVAAYGGFPERYPSWRFGMDYERLAKGYQWGLSKIYELVINNDPTYAYLVSSNSLLEQKLVMAHVYGHADFFKNNVWFAGTDRRMLETMRHFSTRVRALIDEHGQERIEKTLDTMQSLDALIDPYLPQRRASSGVDRLRPALSERRRQALEQFGFDDPDPTGEPKPKASGLDLPTEDVLGFLERHAPLREWERELLNMVRAEAYYFLPQRWTKVANEGWACFWHSKLLTGGLLEPSEILDFADTHAGATAAQKGQLNPYRLGLALWRYAEERGEDLFLMRRIHGDGTLIDALVDEEFSLRYHGVRPGGEQAAREAGFDWRAWKAQLLAGLHWGGSPRIELIGCDAEHRGELVLRHHHDGRDLEISAAELTLQNLAALWRGPVELHTQLEEAPAKVIVDGDEIRVERAMPAAEADPSAS